MLALFCIACVGFCARTAHAAPYYVTVSGLGGEPDYEQRFTALAKDLDKLFKAAASDAHVYTLTGSDATKAHLTDTLGQIAREAKPEDEFTLILIGHGSYDGEVYKFNLPGPDISGEDLALLCDRVPAKRQGKTMNEIRSAFERPMKKAVIYARFSTDLQNERSIEDQVTLCRNYAAREDMNVVEVYEDRARSEPFAAAEPPQLPPAPAR